jgi:1-deoxy-D-xylulose-5-phosphate synthase
MIIQKGLKINLINPIFLKPLDINCLESISNTKVFIYDNTSVFSGFSSEVMKYYNSVNKNIKCFTLQDKYIKHGKYIDVLKYLKMDEETILNEILKYYE